MSTDWFRSTTWDDAVERHFNEKLRRARDKHQYLRIQATILASSHPEVALKLLDQYFALPVNSDHAQAHVDRATALLALGRVEEAIGSYEAALEREAQYPNTLTQAYVELPYLIATHGNRKRYAQAMQLLGKYKSRLTWPVEYYLWHAACALIAAAGQDTLTAKSHARSALDAAALKQSGFRNHASLGLVTKEYDSLIAKLEEYSKA